jgi:hypothetical protein
VRFAIATPLVFATYCKTLCTWNLSAYWICEVVALYCLFCNDIKAYSTKT